MKAIVIERYGGDDQVQYRDMPEPEAGPGQLLLAVHAAGVNPVDWKTVRGQLRQVVPYRLPLILGNECAGTVLAVGEGVRGFHPGDAVYTRVAKAAAGAFAERVAVDAALVAPKPESLDFSQAAAVPLAGLTAWQALVERGRLQAGQSVLIHAGSGGVGSYAVQIAHALGARVITTTSAANAPWVAALGADQVIDYRAQRFEALVADVDLVLDTQAGAVRRRSYRVLKPGGRMVSIAGLPEAREARRRGVRPPARALLTALDLPDQWRARRAGVDYGYLFMEPSGEQLRRLTQLIDSGRLRPVLDRRFPLAQAREAFGYLEQGHARGKVVLEVGSQASQGRTP